MVCWQQPGRLHCAWPCSPLRTRRCTQGDLPSNGFMVLIKVILVVYPVATLTLMLMSLTEMNIRKVGLRAAGRGGAGRGTLMRPARKPLGGPTARCACPLLPPQMMYYRLMTLGIILDWKDTALFKAWFTW